jgi:hypothetical protein
MLAGTVPFRVSGFTVPIAEQGKKSISATHRNYILK